MSNLSVGFVCDYVEEGWPSMNLVARLLPDAVARLDPAVRMRRYQPRARRWFGAGGNDRWVPSIRERLFNRYVYYPRWLEQHTDQEQVFHVLDHTYAHLVHQLPEHRTIVTCHDLDAFRCVLDPKRTQRPWLLRKAVLRTLRGLQRAARVACVSETVRSELVSAGVVHGSRAFVTPNGIDPAFLAEPDPNDQAEADRLLGARKPDSDVMLLHVGIPIPRKRIDFAIRILAEMTRRLCPARLVRVGGALSPDLREFAARSGAADIVELPFLPASVLAAVYRRASVLLVPSEGEGFALPMIEALACGTPVIANDIPVLRETGSRYARYRPIGDVDGWCAEIAAVRARSVADADRWRAHARSHAERFTWTAAAERLLPVYRELSSQ